MSEFHLGLIILIGIVGGIILVSGIGLFVMWIKYSWIEKNNSMNYSGRDISKFVLAKSDLHPQIKSSWFTAKYFNYSKRRNIFKLRPWTHDRKSVWTMMEAAQQSYVGTLRASGKKAYMTIFKIPLVLNIVSLIASAITVVILIKLDFKSTDKLMIIGVAFSAIAVLTSIAEVLKISILKAKVTPMLQDSGLSIEELDKIQRIFKWRYVYAFAVAIMQLLKLILQATSNDKK